MAPAPLSRGRGAMVRVWVCGVPVPAVVRGVMVRV